MLKVFIKQMIIKAKYAKKVRLSKNCNVTTRSKFEGENFIGSGSAFDGILGYGSYLGEDCRFSGKVGKYCSIASGVSVVNGFHPTTNCISTHPAFYSTENCINLSYVNKNVFNEYRYADDINKYDVVVDDDVWIGYRSIIMAGVHIGVGAIIAAGAVVTKNVEPYSIVGGNPARIIKFRFESNQIEKLVNSEWWKLDGEELRKLAGEFSKPDAFLEKMEEYRWSLQ